MPAKTIIIGESKPGTMKLFTERVDKDLFQIFFARSSNELYSICEKEKPDVIIINMNCGRSFCKALRNGSLMNSIWEISKLFPNCLILTSYDRTFYWKARTGVGPYNPSFKSIGITELAERLASQ